MKRMLVIVPSRGRPQNIARLLQGWEATHATARLLVALDEDDPKIPEYMEVLAPTESRCWVSIGPRRRLCGTLNHEAMQYAEHFDVIGFLGDDHLPRTFHWDEFIWQAFDDMGDGIVYGNDLLQGAALPTAVFMSSALIRALGYMAPPVLTHMFLDNFWRDAGNAIGRLRYLPDVIIEHMHHLNNKAQWDSGYEETGPYMSIDEGAWYLYRQDGTFERDVQRMRRVVEQQAIV